MKRSCIAILLAAGSGKRMQSKVAKQYMLLNDKPVIYYGLQAFESCEDIDTVILVVGKGEISYAQKEIVEKNRFEKVKHIIEGGAERYLSVQSAVQTIANDSIKDDDIIMIQDGARPFITEQMIHSSIKAAAEYKACCVAVPVKDTIRYFNEKGISGKTPDRKSLYTIQTPQTFQASVIIKAYDQLNELQMQCNKNETDLKDNGKILLAGITDDCMVVEQMLHIPVKLVLGEYTNIKLTTPEDLIVAEQILQTKFV